MPASSSNFCANPDVIETLRCNLAAAVTQCHHAIKAGKPDAAHEARGRLKAIIATAYAHHIISEQTVTELFTTYELAGE